MRNILYFFLLILSINVDCFVSSVTEGFLLKESSGERKTLIAFSFGLIQSILFLIGYLLGSAFLKFISTFDHYVAFLLLLLIGIHMIYEDIKGMEEVGKGFSKDLKSLVAVAFAVSIDSLAVGLVSSILVKRFLVFALAVFLITFCISLIGVCIGARFSHLAKKIRYAQSLGGLVLIILGVKILLEHLGIF
ncbi:MAG: manganese efflux pump [candidate division WOR-3 bacterium]